jgi:hypothetical protein
MQASFMMAIQGGVKFCAHRRIIVEGRAKSARVTKEEMKGHLTYVPGQLDLLTRAHEYVLDWVKIFFATLWIPRGQQYIEFMFRGDRHRLYREEIVEALGVDLVPTTQVHKLCYPGAVPPRRALADGTPPPAEIVSVLFRRPFSPDSLRSPRELTQLAAVLLLTFKKSLYPRARFGEAITVMQQWFLSLVLGHTPFDLVDLLICEWEDWITNGFKGKRWIVTEPSKL